MMEKITKNLIPICIIAAVILMGGILVLMNQGKIKGLAGSGGSAQTIAQKAIEFINNNFIAAGSTTTASLVSVIEESNVYKISLKIGEMEYSSYITKDGKLLFPDGYALEATTTSASQNQQAVSTEVPKNDKPDVKLFVMSYCPYGLQAQKMFLPVYNLLKDKADMGVYFVSYIMHGEKEKDENLTQYCIETEQKTKYSDYLSCFTLSGDSATCLSQAGIDKAKLNSCISKTDKDFSVTSSFNDKSTWLSGTYPKFNVQADLNTQYGVQGSPTIVINGTTVNLSSRTPEQFKQTVCQAFNNAPEECSQTLSSDSPAAGIGGGTGASSGATCN